tara:strand:+ start:2904 stop:3335 length:432 start_codon:yes stop_codon:yes gene_type:complete
MMMMMMTTGEEDKEEDHKEDQKRRPKRLLPRPPLDDWRSSSSSSSSSRRCCCCWSSFLERVLRLLSSSCFVLKCGRFFFEGKRFCVCVRSPKKSLIFHLSVCSSFKVLWAIVRTLSDKKCEKILTEEEDKEEEKFHPIQKTLN